MIIFYRQNGQIEGGFTLLEIMVAVAIMAIGLVTVMQLFSGAMRSAKVSFDYSCAVIGAKKIMDNALACKTLEDFEKVEKTGEFEEDFLSEYRYEIVGPDLYNLPEELKRDIEDLGNPIDDLLWKLYEITVTVFWGEGFGREKKLEYTTLKLFKEEEKEI